MVDGFVEAAGLVSQFRSSFRGRPSRSRPDCRRWEAISILVFPITWRWPNLEFCMELVECNASKISPNSLGNQFVGFKSSRRGPRTRSREVAPRYSANRIYCPLVGHTSPD